MGRGNFEEGKGRPIVKYRDSIVNRAKPAEPINVVRCVDLGGSKEARVRWGCTLAPPSEYD